MNELNVILKQTSGQDVILIDDVRELNGAFGYPTLEEVIKKIKEINGNYNIIIDHDCLIAIPK